MTEEGVEKGEKKVRVRVYVIFTRGMNKKYIESILAGFSRRYYPGTPVRQSAAPFYISSTFNFPNQPEYPLL